MIERKAVEQEKALLVGVIQPGMTTAPVYGQKYNFDKNYTRYNHQPELL